MGRPRGRPKGSKNKVKVSFQKTIPMKQRATLHGKKLSKKIEAKLEHMQERLDANGTISEREAYIEGCRQAEINEGEEPTPRFKLLKEFQELCAHDGSCTEVAHVADNSKRLYSCDTCWAMLSFG